MSTKKTTKLTRQKNARQRNCAQKVPEFNSSDATKQAARDTALSLGLSVLTSIARILEQVDEPRFDRDGNLTREAKADLLFLAVEAYHFSINWALAADWFDSEVINQTRMEIGHEPIA